MKIIISPAKTQSVGSTIERKFTNIYFEEKVANLIAEIKKLNKSDLGKALKIDGKLLDETYNYYHQDVVSNHAVSLYTGQVFKGLELSNYSTSEMEYLEEHLLILSALYGILKPFDEVSNYRLDMKSKIGINLSKYWINEVNSILDNDLIINLASNEFSSLYQGNNMYTITFKEDNDGKLKVCGTYSKIARGMFLNKMIKGKVKSLSEIYALEVDGYKYNEALSSEKELVFVRKH